MATYSQVSPGDAFLQVVRASHPRLGVLTALAVTVTAGLIHQSFGHQILIFLTVLVGQAILGWHNDLTDEPADRRHARDRKPLVSGPLTARTLWIALTVAGIALIPLATSVGAKAGLFYIGSLLVAMAGNVLLRTGPLSFLSWAGSYALLVPYLSWATGGTHNAPEAAMVACFALVGIGIHVAVSLWGLLADDADGWTYLPLVLGRKYGATQTMAMTIFYLSGIAVALAYVAHTRGFSR
jgi:4-hydroxybenzoate polyprenyltransferase